MLFQNGDLTYYVDMFPGAAIEEGTLKPGDRLLEVNEVCVDGMTQSEVVTLLRNAPQDSEVKLVVSRHLTTTGNTLDRKEESPSKKQIQFHFDDAGAAVASAASSSSTSQIDNDKEVLLPHKRIQITVKVGRRLKIP